MFIFLKKFKQNKSTIIFNSMCFDKNIVIFIFGFIMNFFFFKDVFFCNDYFDSLAVTFSFPASTTMLGIILLHTYIMWYLIVVLIFTVIFIFFSCYTSLYFTSKQFFNLSYFDKQLIKERVKKYSIVKDYLSFSHHSVLEFIWTIIPALILGAIAYPSFILLYTIDMCIDPEFTIIVIGNQWYWTYEYSEAFILYTNLYKLVNIVNVFDFDVFNFSSDSIRKLSFRDYIFSWDNFFDITKVNNKKFIISNEEILDFYFNGFSSLDKKFLFSSNMIPENLLNSSFTGLRLLSTDEILFLPSKTPIKFLITSNDVIHSWAVPSFGIKMDAIPGRLNQVYFFTNVSDEIFWGQCSELCGINHGFMPIEIQVCSYNDFLYILDNWLNTFLTEHYLNFFLMKIYYNFKVNLNFIDKMIKYLNIINSEHVREEYFFWAFIQYMKLNMIDFNIFSKIFLENKYVLSSKLHITSSLVKNDDVIFWLLDVINKTPSSEPYMSPRSGFTMLNTIRFNNLLILGNLKKNLYTIYILYI